MPNKESWIQLGPCQRDEIRQLIEQPPQVESQGAWYKVLRKDEIPSCFSSILKQKCDHAVVMVSDVSTAKDFGAPAAATVVVCNAQRVDPKEKAIDQEPFGIAVIGDEPAPSGLLLHHGDWNGRTVSDLPEGFWKYVESSGVGDYFPFQKFPGGACGPLDDLRKTSHGMAFREVVGRLRGKGGASGY